MTLAISIYVPHVVNEQNLNQIVNALLHDIKM